MKKLNYLFGAALIAFAATMTSCNKDNAIAGDEQGPQLQALFTYDFAAAGAVEENPSNLNGSAANGQAFYAWEREDKANSLRKDYKGYTWAEGSVLPEECHVWRRSNRINGNIVPTGLNCPADNEVAINGLEAGNVVEIFFDATDAADDAKEIIWVAAIGEEGPINTATINGVEAISGETLIASGDKIFVNSVTEANNGTGYITVKVRKGMIISKVIISKAL